MPNPSPNFTREELECPCCKALIVQPILLDGLEKLRATARDIALDIFETIIYLPVSSVYRCPLHNAEVGGKWDSAHVYGKAADIPLGLYGLSVSQHRYVITRAITMSGAFNRVGINRTSIHVDVDENKAQNVWWDYYKKEAE